MFTKQGKKVFLLVLMAATALFVARGSGHVPRQLLLISDYPEISHSTVQAVTLVPAPQPMVLLMKPNVIIAWVSDSGLPLFLAPAIPSLSGRSPPPTLLA